MKIGYDAKRAFLNNTGLGNYSRWVIKAMAQHHPANEYFLYTPKVKKNSRLSFLSQFKNIKTITPVGKLITAWWRSKGVVEDLLRDKVSVYHGLSHELPIGIKEAGIKAVVTIHDLIFMHFPDQFGWIDRNIYFLKVKKSCAVADKIIAISKQTKADLVKLLDVHPSKIAVVYQGCDPSFSVVQTDEQKKTVAAKYSLPEKFILNVGTIEERKNLMLVAKAMPHIISDITLVVVGKHKKYYKQVHQFLKENNLKHKAFFLDKVDFEDLPAIYQMAALFIYPSRYEGFGIPVLEALNCGTPVIAAKGSCLEEAGGPGSIYVGTDDEQELALQVNKVLTDEKLREKMIEEGFKHVKIFDDAKLAEQLNKIYQHA
jgi:glycosyltransferase involved in cell wall biosynthesis